MNAIVKFVATFSSMAFFHLHNRIPKIVANLNDIRVPYSFKYAQQVHYP